MDFSNRIYNQCTIDYFQSRKIPIKTLSPERRKNGKASTKEWVLKSFYGKPKAVDICSTSAAPHHKPSPSRTSNRIETPARKTADREGELSISFDESLVNSPAEKFKHCLVGTFPGSRPPLALIREWIGDQLKLKGEWSVTLLDPSHVFLRLENQLDMVHVWARKRWFIKGSLMKVFKWSPFFRTSDKEEPSLAAVWVSFHSLPVVLFQEEFLFKIAGLVGKVLAMDGATRKMTRTNVARVCVEVDLLKELPKRLWIGIGKRGFWQEITYENLPSYCTHCLLQGHSTTRCNIGSKDAKQTRKSSLKFQGDDCKEQFSQGKINDHPLVTKGQSGITESIRIDGSSVLLQRGFSVDETRKNKEKGVTKSSGESTLKQTSQLSLSVSGTNVIARRREIVSGRANDQEDTGEDKVVSQKHGGSLDQSNRNEESKENEKSGSLEQGAEKPEEPPKSTGNRNKSNSLISKRSPASRSVSSTKRFFFWKRSSKQTQVVERISEVIGAFGLEQYKYSEIKQITRSFINVLGIGGFGTVYEGTLPNGRTVTIKIPRSVSDEEEFVSEVESIGRKYLIQR